MSAAPCYAEQRGMAETAAEQSVVELLRPLDEVGTRRRDGVRAIGRKAFVLAKLLRAALPVPSAWVLEAGHFEAYAARCLPRKHDLRSLIKLSGTKAGDERCARAYEELLAGEIDEPVREAVARLWESTLSALPHGVAVRPSLATSSPRADLAARHLHSRVGLASLEEILTAIREVWASSVLSLAVSAYAAAGLKDVAVAVLLQEVVPTDTVGLLTHAAGANRAAPDPQWHLGVLLETPAPDAGWQRRAQLLVPLAVGEGGPPQPEPLARLRELLEPEGFEQLIDAGSLLERELGPGAVLHFAARRDHQGHCRLSVLGADDSPRWLALEGGDESTVWVEVPFGVGAAAPPTRLSQSVIDRVVDGAARALLETLRVKRDGEAALVSDWSGRSYLNVSTLAAALVQVPLVSPEDVLHAVGGVDPERLCQLAGRSAAVRRSRLRLPLVGASALSEQWALAGQLTPQLRSLEHEVRGFGDMDFTLVPNDAVGTTLIAAQALLEKSAELWTRCTAAQLAHHVALRTLVRRRVRDADAHLAYHITTGAGAPLSSAYAMSAARALEVVRGDAEVSELLRRVRDGREPCPRRASDLPDGRPRGALGQLLASYGDLGLGVLELSEPRFREDAGDLMRMMALLIDAPIDAGSVESLVRRAHALADHELARYEPELSGLERRALHALRDREKQLLRDRAHVDRLLFRALALVRSVVLDIDRRLRRIDPSASKGGAFHCSAARLVAAFKSGRPELTRVIHMRSVERAQQSREPAPPSSFVGAPPRGAIPIVPRATLEGLGVSAGVVEGRARVVRARLPAAIEPGEVLVLNALDVGLAPLFAAAGAVVSELGGALSLGAELARELALPAVAGVRNATLHIRDGEPLRVDGDRGVVQRLDLAEAP